MTLTSFKTLAKESWFKAVAAVAVIVAAPVVGVITGVPKKLSSIVMADELIAAVQASEQKVRSELVPILNELTNMVSQISDDQCRDRRGNIGAAMRDLRVEIAEMEARRDANRAAWTESDDRLLIEWEKQFAALAEEQDELICRGGAPTQ